MIPREARRYVRSLGLLVGRAGIAEDEVEWVETKANPYEVLSGDIADAVFVGTPDTRRAAGTGVFVHIPEPLPMVNGSTMTTLWPNVEKNSALFKNALKALRLGIAFFHRRTGQDEKGDAGRRRRGDAHRGSR